MPDPDVPRGGSPPPSDSDPPSDGSAIGTPPVGEVTELLRAGRAGERAAYDRVFELVYQHLRTAARAQLRRDARHRAGGHTLSTTAVVHEAWLRLADPTSLDVRDRGHFLAIAARAMRQVLIQYARRHNASRRGGGLAPLALDDAEGGGVAVAVDEQAETLVALDEALERLAALNPRLSQVVECRYFGGLSEDEVAEALGVTSRTVRRDWVKARAWLTVELASGDAA